jgi:hypothetical protein
MVMGMKMGAWGPLGATAAGAIAYGSGFLNHSTYSVLYPTQATPKAALKKIANG